jgi:catechol 2,3-dioxygenase-like lactoylglutathione lyase family enzyme
MKGRDRRGSRHQATVMTVQRMDNVLIVVEDLKAATAFFGELGMGLEGETQVEGPRVDSVVGFDGVRADIAMLRTPDGHGQVEPTRLPRRPASCCARSRSTRTSTACASSAGPKASSSDSPSS